jgi:transketolase
MTVLATRSDVLPALVRRITGDEKHAPSAHSTLDVLWVLYDRILRITPETVEAPDRDRFLLSKGHGPAAYYAVLAAKGFIPVEWLDHTGDWDSPLGWHPDRVLIPGVEIGTGSLGHGLGLAVGTALGLRAQGFGDARTFVLLGDAELDEGSNFEAISYVAATRLPLTAIVIDNRSSTHGWPGGIGSRFVGWSVSIVDGRNRAALERALSPRPDHPRVVIATVERKGA